MVPRVGEVMESRRLPIVAADQPLRKAAEVMLANDAGGVVSLDASRRPVLVLSYRRLVRAVAENADLDKTSVADYAVGDPVSAHVAMPVTEALELMRREAVRFLPVVDHRGKLAGVIEPKHVAARVWRLLPYGRAGVEKVLREPVVLSGDVTLHDAAKAMDESGATAVYVRRSDGQLALLREQDFLAAIARGEDPTTAKLDDYARGPAIRVPRGFDARAAAEVLVENNVSRLLVEEPEGRLMVLTVADLAFQALSYIEEAGEAKVLGVVLVNVEPGREVEVASRVNATPGVVEVMAVTGPYDLVVKVEARDINDLHRVVTEGIRSLRPVRSTVTLVGRRLEA